jgi:hypothetical protein
LRGGGEELVSHLTEGCFDNGQLATSGHADATKLQQVVSTDVSAGDKSKQGEKPHVCRSNFAQHFWVTHHKTYAVGVIDKMGKHDAVNSTLFAARHLRHHHVIKESFHLVLLSLVHVGFGQRCQLQLYTGGSRIEFAQNHSFQRLSFFFGSQMKRNLCLHHDNDPRYQLIRPHLPGVENFAGIFRLKKNIINFHFEANVAWPLLLLLLASTLTKISCSVLLVRSSMWSTSSDTAKTGAQTLILSVLASWSSLIAVAATNWVTAVFLFLLAALSADADNSWQEKDNDGMGDAMPVAIGLVRKRSMIILNKAKENTFFLKKKRQAARGLKKNAPPDGTCNKQT